MLSSPEHENRLTGDRANHIISLERLGIRYGRGSEILTDVNFDLERGSFSFLTGASGAGKSTLLKLIGLDMRPTRGLISLFGQATENMSARNIQVMKRKIGFIAQDAALIDHLNIFENVALPLRVSGQKRTSYFDDVRELLRWVGLGERLAHFPPTLSGGEKQRVALARAVITKPDLLLADEPTGNVDPAMGQRLLRLFLEMNRGGTTVLIATHDESLLAGIRADTYRLKGGALTKVEAV